jgi:hypothetical protein
MSRSRKTINVDEVRVSANAFLAQTLSDDVGKREGVASLLSHILGQTGNYKGFVYLHAKWKDGVCIEGDQSRRHYN